MSRRINEFYEFGPFRLDPTEHVLLRDGRPVPLRPKVFDLLLVLVENRGHLVDKEQLMSSVWTEQFVEEGNINKNISMLRQALGENGDQKFIETVPKRGYRFVADVREVTDDKTTQKSLSQPPGVFRRTLTRSRNWISLLIVALMVVGVIVYRGFIRKAHPAVSPPITSIAVLPFQNLSNDSTQDYFVDGMTDALIGDLAKISALRVISRTSSMHFKGSNKSLPQIAAELNVDAVVEGTVQRSGDRVHVRAQLIRAASDSHLWAADYDRDVGDLLDLQSEVARAIAGEVRIKITPSEQRLLSAKRTVPRAAVDNYLQGVYFLNRKTEGDLRKAVGYYESAIAADPQYAQAYAGLADCYNQLGTAFIGVLPALQGRQTAENAARKALEIDDNVAEAHSALGYINHFNWNWSAAEQEFKRAIELNPNYAIAHRYYSHYLISLGRVDEAIAEINRAQELDPMSLTISSSRGYILENARRYEEAIEQLRRVLEVDPNNYQAHWALALTYLANQQVNEAIAPAEKAVTESERTPAALGVLGLAYGLAGRKREANQILKEILSLQKKRYVTPMAIVFVCIGLGDNDQAFAWLEKAYEERSNHIAFFKVNPTVDPLRSDPRFGELLRRIGLKPERN